MCPSDERPGPKPKKDVTRPNKDEDLDEDVDRDLDEGVDQDLDEGVDQDLDAETYLGEDDYVDDEAIEEEERIGREELRHLLLHAGENLDPAKQARLSELGKHAIDVLIEIMADPALRVEHNPGRGWAPVHAAQALGELASEISVGPLLDALATTAPLTPLNNAVLNALEILGKHVVEPIFERLPTAVGEYRQELYALLSKSDVLDKRIFDTLLTLLGQDPETGAMRLSEYGDPAALPYLSAAFDRYQLGPEDHLPYSDSIPFELQEAILELGGTLTPSQEAKYERAVWERRIQMDADEKPAKQRRYPPDALCPCGSGRKYRHCCLH